MPKTIRPRLSTKLKDRAALSNKETLVVDRELVSIKEFLAVRKMIVPVFVSDPQKTGFFKVVDGILQLHFQTGKQDVNGKAIFDKYVMVDATEKQMALNRKLNFYSENARKYNNRGERHDKNIRHHDEARGEKVHRERD